MLDKVSRKDAIDKLSAEGLPANVITTLLSRGSRLHRLAEAQCNGDWPADNGMGHGEPCAICESVWRGDIRRVSWHPSGLVCPDCRTEHEVRELIKKYPGFGVHFEGDPRGAVLIVTTPNGLYNDWGRRGVVVG